MQAISSCQLFPPFKIPLAKSRITVCHFQSNRSAGPRSAPITRRQIPRSWRQGCCTWPSARHCSVITFQRASQPVNVCTGRSKYPAISTELFSFFVENCRFLMQSLALKENLQVNTKALIYILFTNNNICSGFAMCAHKRVLEDVWLFKTLWWLELVY